MEKTSLMNGISSTVVCTMLNTNTGKKQVE